MRRGQPRILSARGLFTSVLGIACVAYGIGGCADDTPPGEESPGPFGATDSDGAAVDPPSPTSEYCLHGLYSNAGYLIECLAEDVSYSRDGEIVQRIQNQSLIEELGGGACCGGCAANDQIMQKCENYCIEYFCEQARQWHNANNSDSCGSSCDFDLEDCVLWGDSGSTQRLGRFWWLGQWVYNEYDVTVQCDGVDYSVQYSQEVGQEFGQSCLDTSELELCVTSDPGPVDGLSTFATQSSAGTQARFNWTFGSNTGTLQSTDLDVHFAYDVVECGAGDCLRVSRFDASIPNQTLLGLEIENVRLTLATATSEDLPFHRGQVDLPSHSISLALFGEVSGFPLFFTVPLLTQASGTASPAADALTLRGLRFGFERLGVSATLDMNLSSTYTARPPTTAILIVDEPAECVDPVVFAVQATDLDGDDLEHIWLAGDETSRGAYFERALEPGAHHVTVTTVDETGRTAGAFVEYVRTCR